MRSLLCACGLSLAIPSLLIAQDSPLGKSNWSNWRGPLQTGASLESFRDYQFNPEPVWTDAIADRKSVV